MNVEISDQVTKQIEAVLANVDHNADHAKVALSINRIVERVAADDQLLLSFLVEDPTEEEMAANLERIDRGMADVEAGRTRPMREALDDIAGKLGLSINR